jgi:hypothetical protein
MPAPFFAIVTATRNADATLPRLLVLLSTQKNALAVASESR